MFSEPAQALSDNSVSCVTPAWGTRYVAQQAVIYLRTYPENTTVVFTPETGMEEDFEYLYDFYQVLKNEGCGC
jgi:hypothetical protein